MTTPTEEEWQERWMGTCSELEAEGEPPPTLEEFIENTPESYDG
jgi:hypothetical protein